MVAALSVGWGAIADHDFLSEGQLRWLGVLRDVVVPAWIIWTHRTYRGKVAFMPVTGEPRPTRAHRVRASDGWVEIEDSFCLVHCCNLPWISHDTQCAPGSAPADGRIALLLMRNATRRDLISMFLNSQSGDHVAHPAVELYWALDATIEPEPEPVGSIAIDGEAVGYPRLTRLTSWPSATSIVTAAHGVS